MWEYRIEKVKTGGMVVPNLDAITNEWLNQFGKASWELVQVVPLPRGGGTVEQVYLFFKRRATD